MKQNFRFSGTGGQGLITAGIILAEAALLDGLLAVQSQSYGPEARGGSSKAEVILADEPIRFGRVTHPDTLLVMSQEAADKFSGDCDGSSLIVTDSLFVQEVRAKDARRVDLPITHTARETCGKALFANIVALGAVVALTICVSTDSLERAVLGRVPKGTEDANRKALSAGYALAKAVK
ncbi:MAG: 2-oxoacid:acceptor oxidoreductase family protein [Schwartzia sp.]|nr:2-oxoacid:acceptor oxidoreductase family protein [Schwartzia sp. (in: firmicutes)]